MKQSPSGEILIHPQIDHQMKLNDKLSSQISKQIQQQQAVNSKIYKQKAQKNPYNFIPNQNLNNPYSRTYISHTHNNSQQRSNLAQNSFQSGNGSQQNNNNNSVFNKSDTFRVLLDNQISHSKDQSAQKIKILDNGLPSLNYKKNSRNIHNEDQFERQKSHSKHEQQQKGSNYQNKAIVYKQRKIKSRMSHSQVRSQNKQFEYNNIDFSGQYPNNNIRNLDENAGINEYDLQNQTQYQNRFQQQNYGQEYQQNQVQQWIDQNRIINYANKFNQTQANIAGQKSKSTNYTQQNSLQNTAIFGKDFKRNKSNAFKNNQLCYNQANPGHASIPSKENTKLEQNSIFLVAKRIKYDNNQQSKESIPSNRTLNPNIPKFSNIEQAQQQVRVQVQQQSPIRQNAQNSIEYKRISSAYNNSQNSNKLQKAGKTNSNREENIFIKSKKQTTQQYVQQYKQLQLQQQQQQQQQHQDQTKQNILNLNLQDYELIKNDQSAKMTSKEQHSNSKINEQSCAIQGSKTSTNKGNNIIVDQNNNKMVQSSTLNGEQKGGFMNQQQKMQLQPNNFSSALEFQDSDGFNNLSNQKILSQAQGKYISTLGGKQIYFNKNGPIKQNSSIKTNESKSINSQEIDINCIINSNKTLTQHEEMKEILQKQNLEQYLHNQKHQNTGIVVGNMINKNQDRYMSNSNHLQMYPRNTVQVQQIEKEIQQQMQLQQQMQNMMVNQQQSQVQQYYVNKQQTMSMISKYNIQPTQLQTYQQLQQQLQSQNECLLEMKEKPKKKEAVYHSNVPTDNAYRFYCSMGNNGQLIKKVLETREWWKETNSYNSSYNLKWVCSSNSIKFERLGGKNVQQVLPGVKQLVNQFEGHKEMTTKSGLIKNLKIFCETNKCNLFDMTPCTFILDINDPCAEQQLTKFSSFFLKNQPKNNNIVQATLQSGKPDSIKKRIYEFKKRLKPILNNASSEKSQKCSSFTKPKLQSSMTSAGRYLWLLKPTGFNRGRGIQIFSTLEEFEKFLFDFGGQEKEKSSEERDKYGNKIKKKSNAIEQEMVSPSNQQQELDNEDEEDQDQEKDKDKEDKQEQLVNPIIKNSAFVIQKYIENPLLINNRKFDIRVWMMVTPNMDVYFFKEGYIRTSCVEFNIQSEDYYVHLTNNAVQRNAANYGQFEDGNLITFKNFDQLMKDSGHEKCEFMDRIYPQIKDYCNITIQSIKKKLNPEDRKYCFQIYGYDYLIDTDYNLWLIEVNNNPCLEETANYLEQLMPRMIDDAFKLTLDQIFPKKKVQSHTNITNKESKEKQEIKLSKPPIILDQLSNIIEKEEVLEEEHDRKKELADRESPNKNGKKKQAFSVDGYKDDENMWELLGNLMSKQNNAQYNKKVVLQKSQFDKPKPVKESDDEEEQSPQLRKSKKKISE